MTKTAGRAAAVTVLALLTASALSACGTDDGSSNDSSSLDLSGRSFVGDAVTVDDAPYDLVDGSTIHLTFDDSSITASAGCNTMSGPARWSDGTLTIDGSLASTEMGCDQALMDQDTWLMDFLTSSPALELDGETLTLENDTTTVTLTDEEVAVPDASLSGTVWQLDSIATGQTVSSVPAGVTASLELDDSGSLHAELGCNIGNGSYTTDGDTLEVGPLATTRKACGQAESEVEAAMLAVLAGKSTYAIDGDQLTLTPVDAGSADPSALTFRAAAATLGDG